MSWNLSNIGFKKTGEPVVEIPFIFTVSGSSFALPLVNDGTYNFEVSWGDGSSDTITAWNQAEVTHTYSSSGSYEIQITGTINGWSFNNTGDKSKITNISQWGDLLVGSGHRAFTGCTNLTVTATDILDTSACTTFFQFFWGCSSLTSVPNINEWDTSSVTSLERTFENCSNFNQSLNGWDTSAVTTLRRCFEGCTNFNSSISDWNTALVSNMSGVFTDCSSYNQALPWNTALVQTFGRMFRGCSSFNQALSFNTSSATNMGEMFHTCTVFDQDISGWDVSSVTTMNQMFQSATNFNQPIGAWTTSALQDTRAMFFLATSFDQDLSNWDVTNLTLTTSGGGVGMFQNAGLSTANYDALLIGWEAQAVQNSLNFDAGSSQYTAGGAAEAARSALIADHFWTITDGGAV